MYRSFVGLEIHVQLLTQTKIFCGCRAGFGDEPNTNVCPVCMGYPGVLPTLNGEAIEMAYTVARALNCELTPECSFDRKNYFYPDLPKNYQISQYHAPLGRQGYLDLEFRKKKKRVRIHQIHLEEDAGKMIHAGDMSLLDYNRTGTPLLEIVTEPDLEIGEEAEALLQELRRIVRYLGVCDGNMEEGSLRCDANVSVNLEGAGLGSKVEIKNLNSSRFVRKALNFEIERQEEILERGGTVAQETRLWNENRDQSESMRTKESAHDYRYFPEPDLPHFHADAAFLRNVEERQVELPAERRARFQEEWKLSVPQTEFLCDEKETADCFELVLAEEPELDPEMVVTWLAGDVRKQLNRRGWSLTESPLTPPRLAQLLRLLAEGTIHGKIAKQTLELLFEGGRNSSLDPIEIIEEQGWKQIAHRSELEPFILSVIEQHEGAAEQVRQGESKPVGFLMGQVMKATEGRAEPAAAQALLQELLLGAPPAREPRPESRAGSEATAPRRSPRIPTIQVLSFGGAIAGHRREDGLVEPGDLVSLGELFRQDPDLPEQIVFEEIRLGRFLSEEITPADWSALLTRLASTLEERSVQGIVVAHGTDTLAYTAGLVYWFFADTSVPIVLTAGAVPTDEGERGESVANLRRAVQVAAGAEAGIHVVYGGEDFMPVNLRFERIAPSPEGETGSFRTWNPVGLRRRGAALAPTARSVTREVLTAVLESALRRTFVVRVFPGMPGETLIALMDAGIRYFILEIYDTGTANLRETPFSLRKALVRGRERGVSFFCTSQQEGVVDFSGYVTAHELWRNGAIPMGGLTTESAFTRLVAAQVEAALVGAGGSSDSGAGDRGYQSEEEFRERVLHLMT
ncbi:MAG: Asp-tRNA(Asn)/Glu-tRNA(Gln) amidotransferase subunit GatB [Spirochaetaceae bacterium]|nr:MAG: Asp-tRNA(Asn)/Glu-tRNA(Gln) amidotransferase subunit GatB [Spirochaetaceae bacterium]